MSNVLNGVASACAFQNSEQQKNTYFSRIENEISKGGRVWENDKSTNGREAIPRFVQAAKVLNNHNYWKHEDLAQTLGIPLELVYICERIFEFIPSKPAALEWLKDFIEAIPVGADLSETWRVLAPDLFLNGEFGLIRIARTDEETKLILLMAELYLVQTGQGERLLADAASGIARLTINERERQAVVDLSVRYASITRDTRLKTPFLSPLWLRVDNEAARRREIARRQRGGLSTFAGMYALRQAAAAVDFVPAPKAAANCIAGIGELNFNLVVDSEQPFNVEQHQRRYQSFSAIGELLLQNLRTSR